MKKKNAFIVLILSALLMTGCQTTSRVAHPGSLKAEISRKIPHLSNRIYVTMQDVSADQAFDELLNILAMSNHLTLVTDREKHIVLTDTKDVGHSTLQRMAFVIEEKGSDAQIKITTQWRSGANAVGFTFPVAGYSLQENWAKTQWEKNRLGIAMAESNAIANQFDKGIVAYRTDESELAWYNHQRKDQSYLAWNNTKKEKKSDLAVHHRKKENKRKDKSDIAYNGSSSFTDNFNYGVVSNDVKIPDLALNHQNNSQEMAVY